MPPKRRAAQAPSTETRPTKARPSKLAKEHGLSAAEEAEIKEAFALFAQDHSEYADSKEGVIPTGSVKRALAALGAPITSQPELADILETLDPDEEGFVAYANFLAIAAIKLQGRGEEEQKEEIEKAFQLFTRGSEGKITIATLRRIARELKEDVDEQVLRDMIAEANGGSGVGKGVALQDFEGVMRRAGVFH